MTYYTNFRFRDILTEPFGFYNRAYKAILQEEEYFAELNGFEIPKPLEEMKMAENLLTDAQMRHFIVNGFVTVTTALPPAFHDDIFERTVAVFDKEGNPGNNLLPRIPEIQRVFDDENVKGALTSLLGPDCYMQPHRHPHYNPPGSNGQGMHQDGGKRWSHHTRRLLVFYYPQDTPN